LDEVAELGFKVDGAVKFVVAELGMDRSPYLVCSGLGCTDEGSHILGDGVVQPRYDALIDHDPFRIVTVVSGGGGAEMRGEAELADEGVEEALPLSIVGVRKTELNGNVSANVYRLENGVGGRLNDGVRVGEGFIRGGGRRAIGGISLKELVGGIHGARGAAKEEVGRKVPRRDDWRRRLRWKHRGKY
jgi:hypothetical protein